MVAARYGLQYMLENKVEAEVKRKEKIVRTYFNDNLQGDAVQIRGIGLIWGIQVADGKTALAIANRCFEKGLIIERAGRDNDVVKLMPALTIPDDQLVKGLDILVSSVKEICNL